MSAVKILIIVKNISVYASGNLQTGLWLSELTHIYENAKNRNYFLTIASPTGGNAPIDPESLRLWLLDKTPKKYMNDTNFRDQLLHTKSLQEVENDQFDIIYLAGGHGTMYDFPKNKSIQKIIVTHYEAGSWIAAICHGVSGLINVKLSNGEYLIKDKRMIGYSWFEETIANIKREVPFNLEKILKARGAIYKKALIPMTSKVVVHGKLVTGQNPFSSKQMIKVLMEEFDKYVNR